MKHHTASIASISFFFAFICPFVETEVYTAIADLGQLLLTNSKIFHSLNKYLAIEEDRLRTLRWLKDQYETLSNIAMKDEDSFFTNPINAYMLVKRLTEDWKTTGDLIEEAQGKALLENVSFMGLQFPNEEDLNGAATALLRLQDTYLLNTSQLARGEISNVKLRSSELTAGDCFQLGFQAIAVEDYKRAIQWLQEALAREEREEIKTAHEPSILEHLAHCAFKLKHIKHAIKLTNQIMTIEPRHPGAAENLAHYESVLNAIGDAAISGEEYEESFAYSSDYEVSYEPDSHSFKALKRVHMPDFDNYEKLCRGERTRSHRVESQMKCRYTTNGNSYLLLQPVKQEILSLDPFICVYHDIISDKDIELFKEISRPRLETATVLNPKSGVWKTVKYRVSKSTWLKETEHPRVAHASEIIKDVTGLETNTAEELHIINYGMGGHYEPHYDFKMDGAADAFAHLSTGNRIATWIYYLSDVEAGGATVFPKVGVSLKPRRGSAGFWYNLRKSGDGDLNTLHAGCPVLSGSKWVGNKWFHEVNNEFRRKCSVDPRQ